MGASPGTLRGDGGWMDAGTGPMCVQARAARLAAPSGAEATREGCSLSAELHEEACKLPDAASSAAMSVNERAVHSWLRKHQNQIIEAEQKYAIDRRAIAGAIAWEAINNVRGKHAWSRWRGPGKVHVDVNFYESVKQTAAEQVEKLGYLPALSQADRESAVARPSGAIEYIAAIMRAQADIVRAVGGYSEDETNWNPPVLTTWYQGKHPSTLAKEYAENKWAPSNHPLKVPGGDATKEMGTWVQGHLRFLEDAVGVLPVECRPDAEPLSGTRLPAEATPKQAPVQAPGRFVPPVAGASGGAGRRF